MDSKMLVIVSLICLFGLTGAAPAAKADVALVATSPVVAAAPAVVTATSSQVIARNYNGIAAPLVAAPAVVPAVASIAAVPAVAPVAAAPYAAYPYAPFVTYY